MDEDGGGVKTRGLNEQGNSILETDSSISILEMPWSVKIDRLEVGTQAGPQDVFPDFIDPLFLDCYFVVPAMLRSIVEKMDERKFVYRHGEGRTFKVTRCRSNECVYAMDVLDFGEEVPENQSTSVVLVINRSSCRSAVRVKQDCEYRAAMGEGRRYSRASDAYVERMNVLYRLQIQNGMNFIFVEKPQDLLDAMKAVLKHLSSKREYIPKTKTFGVQRRTEHLQNLLQSIPGIGKSVASCLSVQFKTIKELHAFLRKDDGSMREFRVWSEDNRHFRILGEKQCRKIRAAFLGRRTSG